MDKEEKIMGMPPHLHSLCLYFSNPPSHLISFPLYFDFPFLPILVLSLGRKRVLNGKEKSCMFCTNLWIEKFM